MAEYFDAGRPTLIPSPDDIEPQRTEVKAAVVQQLRDQMAGRKLRPATSESMLVVDVTPEHPALRDLRAYLAAGGSAPEIVLGWLVELSHPDVAAVVSRLGDLEDSADAEQVWAVYWFADPDGIALDGSAQPVAEAYEEHDNREDAEHALRCGGGHGEVVSRWVGPLTDWTAVS